VHNYIVENTKRKLRSRIGQIGKKREELVGLQRRVGDRAEERRLKKDKWEQISKKRTVLIHVSQASLHHPVFTSSWFTTALDKCVSLCVCVCVFVCLETCILYIVSLWENGAKDWIRIRITTGRWDCKSLSQRTQTHRGTSQFDLDFCSIPPPLMTMSCITLPLLPPVKKGCLSTLQQITENIWECKREKGMEW